METGFKNWSALKESATEANAPTNSDPKELTVLNAVPILFVRDVTKAAEFYNGRLGFHVDFLHGLPPFYGSVSRDSACIHLRFVHTESNFTALAAAEKSLILVSLTVRNVEMLFEEYESRGVEFTQRLVRQAWGGLDFHVRDLDGNVISFVQFPHPDSAAE